MCRFCGSVPAVEATIRGHQGLVIIMWFRYVHGPFCRSCGIATHREMTTRSLWQGWWSVFSMFINPITMLINVPQRLKINKLPPPIPGSPGTPMPVGKPVLARPAAWVALVPIIVIGIIIAPLTRAVMNDPTYADVGDCLHNSGTMSSPDLEVTDCGGSQAEYKVVGKLSGTTDIDRCRQFADQGSEIGYYQQQGSSRFVLCLAPAEG
ncbi:hypothetical protein ACIQGZ_01165 [Streptomyces sp. NPDC092296]|uniref:LppU/SCO3897 family protein n=1 Tax=Streptomyces sp. NPDC092296 TaxID=3366012 RepID=UPI0037F8A176